MLIGRLGADPEIKQTKKGESFANLSLATNKKYKTKDGEWQEKTTWHKIVVWDPRLADTMQKYAKSGTQLFVEGEIETRQFKDSNDQNRIVTEVVIPRFTGSIRMVGDKPSGTKTAQQSKPSDDFDDQF
jgi:single-strand DNA-binding protein|tara:strand:- start:509 stop:895 length:387 start_codon:yes stop_codon:yes gene_type:complete